MKKILFLVLIVSLNAGCVGLGGRTSYVKAPDGKMWEIRCQSDGKVDYTDGTIKMTVDNRGPLGQVWAAATASLGKIYETVKGDEVKK